MKAKKITKKKLVVQVNLDIDKALGSAKRDEYLKDNPHGYAKINHVHKNKKKYNRKTKYPKNYS